MCPSRPSVEFPPRSVKNAECVGATCEAAHANSVHACRIRQRLNLLASTRREGVQDSWHNALDHWAPAIRQADENVAPHRVRHPLVPMQSNDQALALDLDQPTVRQPLGACMLDPFNAKPVGLAVSRVTLCPCFTQTRPIPKTCEVEVAPVGPPDSDLRNRGESIGRREQVIWCPGGVSEHGSSSSDPLGSRLLAARKHSPSDFNRVNRRLGSARHGPHDHADKRGVARLRTPQPGSPTRSRFDCHTRSVNRWIVRSANLLLVLERDPTRRVVPTQATRPRSGRAGSCHAARHGS